MVLQKTNTAGFLNQTFYKVNEKKSSPCASCLDQGILGSCPAFFVKVPAGLRALLAASKTLSPSHFSVKKTYLVKMYFISKDISNNDT